MPAKPFNSASRPSSKEMPSQSLSGVAHGFADQDLTATGLPGDPRRHRDVAAEQVVAAAHRAAHVDPDPHSNTVVPLPLCVSLQRVLHVDAAAYRLLGLREGDHESVALAFHHMPGAFLDQLADQLVVLADQLDPGPVADPFVERGGFLDIGEQDRHPAVRGDPGQVRALHLGPIGEIFDGAAHRGAEPLLAHQVRGLPRGLDRF